MYRVIVFAYDFPHQKTADFLFACATRGVEIVSVIAAPRKDLSSHATFRGYQALPEPPVPHSREVCDKLGMDYDVRDHADVEGIRRHVASTGANVGIIAGARIIGAEVIEQFRHGIINFHPGKIPETSGLDAFYWMLEKQVPAGVTAHCIDHKVDAGQFIGFERIEVSIEDTLATIARKLYVCQLTALYKIIDTLRLGDPLVTSPIDRPAKNLPMSDAQRKAAVAKFNDWKHRFATDASV